MSKKEKTILYAICAVIVCAVVAVCVTQNTTGSREKEMKKLLANNWYRQWSESVSFTLYDDGTVTIPGSYGQGKWSLVNDDVLKISDFYGETMTLKIDDLDDQCNRQISRRIKKHLWLSNRSWARDVHSFGILHSWGALAGKSCSAQASSIWLIAGAFRRTQSK